MVEQTADISVMQGLGGGSVAVRGRNFGIGHKGLHQSLEMRFWNDATNSASVCQSSSYSGWSWKIVGEVDFRLAQLAQLVNGKLEAVLILVD